jgi:hypothetical protein
MLIQSARRDKPFDPRIRIGFVVLIDQAMEVLVPHVEAVIVILKLLVWIVALLVAKERPVGVPTLFAEVHLGGMNGEHVITILEDNPTILVQEPSLGLKIWVAHNGIISQSSDQHLYARAGCPATTIALASTESP